MEELNAYTLKAVLYIAYWFSMYLLKYIHKEAVQKLNKRLTCSSELNIKKFLTKAKILSLFTPTLYKVLITKHKNMKKR